MLGIILSGFFQIPLDNSNSLFDSQSWSLAIITWCSNWCLSIFVWFVSFRYPPHGRRAAAVENGVTWDRLRAPPIDTSPHDLHISDCLNELRPGDHIEIQWRRNKEFPYGLLLNFILPFISSFWYLYSCFKSLHGCWLGAYLTYSFLFIIFLEFFNYFLWFLIWIGGWVYKPGVVWNFMEKWMPYPKRIISPYRISYSLFLS